MKREMSSDSEDSYISELSDSDHEERKVEEEQSSVRIASSVRGTNVTSQIKPRGILTARFEYQFLDLYPYVTHKAVAQRFHTHKIVISFYFILRGWPLGRI